MVSDTGNQTVLAAQLKVFLMQRLGSVSQMAGTTHPSNLVREPQKCGTRTRWRNPFKRIANTSLVITLYISFHLVR